MHENSPGFSNSILNKVLSVFTEMRVKRGAQLCTSFVRTFTLDYKSDKTPG